MEGDIDAIDSVLRITKIRVAYHLKCSDDQMDAVNRAYEHHPTKCPAYMTYREDNNFSFSLENEYD